jgi:methylamine dehydrogenase accessory protein MauD
MTTALLIATAGLCLVVLFLGFLLLGTLRAVGLLGWRLAELEATTPRRPGREGLKPGRRAPDFTLPGADGREVALHDFAGRRVLLVFTQSGCSPCQKIVPELNRLADGGAIQVVVVTDGDPEATRKWSAEVDARFPVLAQDHFAVSKRYEVFASPFAFLIDEKGVIASKGIIHSRQHMSYVLAGTRMPERIGHAEPGTAAAAGSESKETSPIPISAEVHHVLRRSVGRRKRSPPTPASRGEGSWAGWGRARWLPPAQSAACS